MSVIERILDILKERNMTAKELSKAVGISAGNITDWKNGRCEPSQKAIQKIAEYFGYSTDYLLGLSDEKNAGTNDEIQVAFSSGFAGLNDENKKTAMDIIAGLKAKQDLEGK